MKIEEEAFDFVEVYVEQLLDVGLYRSDVLTNAKNIALIAVGQIINALREYDTSTEGYLKDEFGLKYFSAELQNMESSFRYWDKFKNEINNL